MAWNGSDNTGSAPVKKSAGVKPAASGSVPKVLLAAAVVAALCAAVVAYFLFRDSGKPVPKAPEKPSGGKIVEATPAATNRAPKADKPEKELTPEEKRRAEIRRYEEMYGTNMPPGIKARVHFLKHPPEKVYKIKNRFEFLRHPSERQIASLMSVAPGTFMLSPPEYGSSFNEDFLAALMEKIEVLPDDDEETRAVKDGVSELKKEIVAIQRESGKLPSEIMNEHAKFLYEMGQIEQNLENELVKARSDPSYSDEDVEDLFAAANKMRRDRGLPEWKIPDFSRRSAILQRRLARHSKENSK
ncbi:MAG: hypothetical protein IJG70_04435 [Kiritimatiellae bacterium]|nr:hypothetical protein [Kiritimatiellia bacterium]